MLIVYCCHSIYNGEITTMVARMRNEEIYRLNMKFIEACQKGDLNQVRHLLISPTLEQHANIHATNLWGQEDGGLVEACKAGHLDIVQYLLTSAELPAHGVDYANIKTTDSWDTMLLHIACACGHVDIVRFLLTNPILKKKAQAFTDLSVTNLFGTNCLEEACSHGHIAVAKYLIASTELAQHGIKNADIHDNAGGALAAASQSGQLAMVKYLLSLPQMFTDNPHAQQEMNVALQKACYNNHVDIVDYLLTSEEIIQSGGMWAQVNASNADVLRSICETNAVDTLKYLTTSAKLRKSQGEMVKLHANNDKAFRLACAHGHLEVVKFLSTSPELKAGGYKHANIHAQREEGFIKACSYGHLEVVKFLILSREIKENHQTPINLHANHDAAFCQAYKSEHMEIVKFLIMQTPLSLTPRIASLIKDDAQMTGLFEKKELQEKLHEDLGYKNALKPRAKI